MAGINSEIIVMPERRPCYVKGKKAMFHQWTHESEILEPAIRIGGHPGGVVAATLGIVEYEDGKVSKVYPENIVFADGGDFVDTAFMPSERSSNE